MDYISAQEASQNWDITKRRVQLLCASNRISGAVKIGNMWVIPADAQKPTDGRLKNKTKTSESKYKNPIRVARNKIKVITHDGMKCLYDNDYSHDEAKLTMVYIFASELLLFYTSAVSEKETIDHDQENLAKSVIADILGVNVSERIIGGIRDNIHRFIRKNAFCCDDALSWCYQYANKMKKNSEYSNTQFFTEKYMISAIVDSMDILSRKKIIDPACGGGNFLLYCMDMLADTGESNLKEKEHSVLILQQCLSKLYGYEIDKLLALTASVNLRLKCLSILIDRGYSASVYDFESFVPNIYYPVGNTIAGALEVTRSNHIIKKAGTDEATDSKKIFSGIDAIITNPPFQTIKGMHKDLKNFLKKEYPRSKCDMCNAFLELSYELLDNNGAAGVVTQNSWMYLDSFVDLRRFFLSSCTIERIWELGSNAFYDLSGEKSNVALLIYKKTMPAEMSQIKLTFLRTMDLADKESFLLLGKNNNKYNKTINQHDIYINDKYRFDMISSAGLRTLLLSKERYGDHAVPMQGTSTGNSKELIDFFWKHIDDPNWVLVSKGGGYSRWSGLNHYCVKWGKDGEFIKATKGSVIRNAAYFNETQMVFSDTGTSGLNVRELLSNQIFVASGPGIRIIDGNKYAHLAFLNSRFSAYFIRLLSPKLTIAAGYISKIPVLGEILKSNYLEEKGKKCIQVKNNRLSKRPDNIEFVPVCMPNDHSIEENAYRWFLDDMEDEWIQLQNEDEIDEYIFSKMGLSEKDLCVIDEFVGCRNVFSKASKEAIYSEGLEENIKNSIDCNCNILRKKTTKKSLGCDGLLEYLSQKTGISCEAIYKFIIEQRFYPNYIKEKYEDLYMHAIVISAIGYPQHPISSTMPELIKKIGSRGANNCEWIRNWIEEKFNHIHSESLLGAPLFKFDLKTNMILYRKD